MKGALAALLACPAFPQLPVTELGAKPIDRLTEPHSRNIGHPAEWERFKFTTLARFPGNSVIEKET